MKLDKQQLKEKIKQKISEHKRKRVEGRPNIEGVSAPKKRKPKKVAEHKVKAPQAASVSIGAHGGRYIQEPSGHKRYVSDGSLSGRKKFKKSIQNVLEAFVKGDNNE